MKINFIIVLLSLVVSTALLSSCADDSIPFNPNGGPVTTGLIPLDTGYVVGGNTRIFMYAGDSLTTGYNKVYFVLYDSTTGTLITDAHIELSPMNHGVGSPVENPPSLAVNGIFEGAIVFTAPQTDSRHWHLHVHVHNHQSPGQPEGEVELEGFHIKDAPLKHIPYYTADSTLYLFSYIKPKQPVNGMNDFEFLLNRKFNNTFIPETSFNVHVAPEWVEQGFSPVGSIDPVASPDGHYKGQIKLTSNGTWRLHLNFNNGGNINDSVYFEISY